jgi:hypothetical protein
MGGVLHRSSAAIAIALGIDACAPKTLDLGGDDGGGSTDAGGDGGQDVVAPCPGIDDRWILFDSDYHLSSGIDIYAARASGDEVTRLTDEIATHRQPTVAPSRNRVAFASNRDDLSSTTLQIYVADLPNALVFRVTSVDGGADEPAWSPDGTRIAFHTGAGEVHVLDVDAGTERLLAAGDGGFGYAYPSFTPDGDAVLVDHEGQGFDQGVDGVDRIELEGGVVPIIPAVAMPGLPTVRRMSESSTGSGYALGVLGCPQSPEQWRVVFLGLGVPFDCESVTLVAYGQLPAFGPQDAIAFENERDGGAGADAWITSMCTGPRNVSQLLPGAGNHNVAWAPAGFQPIHGLPLR